MLTVYNVSYSKVEGALKLYLELLVVVVVCWRSHVTLT